MHSCLYLHFSFFRISLKWRIRGEKPSCCPEWSILTSWPSGKPSKVIIDLTLQDLLKGMLDSSDIQLLSFWLYENTQCDCLFYFMQLMTSCVLLWSTAVEETCCRGSGSRRRHSFVLMTYASATCKYSHDCIVILVFIWIFFPSRSWGGSLKCVQVQSISTTNGFYTGTWSPRYSSLKML